MLNGMSLINILADERAARGWSQARMATAAGISRQSYAATEAGNSVPSTEVALRLAAVLGRPVEELFRLPQAPGKQVSACWAGDEELLPTGRRVRLSRVAGQQIAFPMDPVNGPTAAADGIVTAASAAEVTVSLLEERPAAPELALVGCDPAFGIVADSLRRERGVEVAWMPRGSRAAIATLARGHAHIAGAHLHDPETGEANTRWIREAIPFPCTRVIFAVWEQGLLLPPGNPAGIRSITDLARPDVRFLNRETGSGSRIILDEALAAAGVDRMQVAGYDTEARSHFAVGEAIASGLADAGVAIRAAAAAFGLETILLRTEAYELIIPDHFLDLPGVGALLDTLSRPGIRAQVEALQGYDTVRMGQVA